MKKDNKNSSSLLPKNDKTGKRKKVVYLIVCGCPPACQVGELVDMAQKAGWAACVIASPDGSKFINMPALVKQTGFPVRTQFKTPGHPDILPPPDALVVAPASVNTINKWAAGICDTLALGLVVEGIGMGYPIVTMPFTNKAHAAHPAFRENLDKLSSWGVRVLFGDDILPLHDPRAGERPEPLPFPWHVVMQALEEASTK